MGHRHGVEGHRDWSYQMQYITEYRGNEYTDSKKRGFMPRPMYFYSKGRRDGGGVGGWVSDYSKYPFVR